MKKTLFTIVIALIAIHTTNAQVGIGTTTPDASAQLEVQSTTKGFLPPRMIAAKRNTISNPAQGLMIYCTNCGSNGEAQLYNGTDWTNMTGDAATDAPSNIYWVEKANDGTNDEFIVRTDLDGNNKVTLVTSEGFAVQNFGSNMQVK
ncbi:hypothetical protein [Psychroflexus maritimus]|uniref:NlpE N-terminal domain-containing protein n=1 Tax=Psychroflexus maritimus TaxID=2714865 RepID=A0A967E2Z8_9FLAO|nr:hypothetical protein [Psychroflexus maritimus]NGZ90214.1 hypothetical protein [Psychroflexus maritimus]